MRSTSSIKNGKENFYSKNSNNGNGISNVNNNSRSPLKMLNFNQNSGQLKFNNFQNLMQKKDLNTNVPSKPIGVNLFNSPNKLKENGTNSPNLPFINNSNVGGHYNNNFNSNTNTSHSRYSSNISYNSNKNNSSINNFNVGKTPYADDNMIFKAINSNNNNSYGINNNQSNSNGGNNNYNINKNYSNNGGYNNLQNANNISIRNPSAMHYSSISNNGYSDSTTGISGTNSNLLLINNNKNANTNNNITNSNLNSTNINHNNRPDSSSARIRTLSRQQSNSNVNSNYANNNISENNNNNNNIRTNYNDVKSNCNSNITINNTNSNSLQIKFDISQKIVGFKNLGNTCFMNTSLQCILHCDVFISQFLKYCDLKKPLRPTPISNSLLNLIESYSKASDKSAISPDELKKAVARKHHIYSGFSQQDSQEFIRKLLDEISQELNLVTDKKPYKILNANNEQENKNKLSSEYDKIFRDRENSIIVDTFYGQSISIFSCLDCNYESYSFEKFLDIPLLLEESYNNQDLEKLLGKYFESENIQWESPCDNKACKRKSMHKKKLRLSGLPDVLILSLQRYNNRLRRKNNSKVNFKEEIDLKEYTDSACLFGIYIIYLCLLLKNFYFS